MHPGSMYTSFPSLYSGTFSFHSSEAGGMEYPVDSKLSGTLEFRYSALR